MRVARDTSTARRAFAGFGPGDAIHGLTDGSWSLIDALREIIRIIGPARVTLSTWTAAAADLREAERWIRSRSIVDLRLCVDRSFLSRQPRYCKVARDLFGDDAIRVWSSHAKFCVMRNADADVLLLTSANLNRNRRVENFSLHWDRDLAEEYIALVDKLFALQQPATGFDAPRRARHDTDSIMEISR